MAYKEGVQDARMGLLAQTGACSSGDGCDDLDGLSPAILTDKYWRHYGRRV
jgi:hypothetical protein